MPPKHDHSHKHFDNLKLSKLESGEVEVTGELTLDFLAECRGEALKALSERIKIDGFRPGHISEATLVKQIGEMRVLEEVAEVALANSYGHIIRELKVAAIGRPKVAITKLAPGIPLEFKITVMVEPEFDLPDYKKVANEVSKETLKDEATEEEKFWAREKRRAAIIEALVKATEIKIPKQLIEMRPDRSETQLKAEMILVNIADKEKIEPTAEELEAEAKHMLVHHPDADPLRVRLYVFQLLRNSKVLEFLETA